jgi:nucleotide-binding universal stress UspA family protein
MAAAGEGDVPRPHAAEDPHPAIERVLLATDGGEAGHAAMRWLEDRATSVRLEILVLTVVPFDPLNFQYYGDDLTTEAERIVRQTSDELRSAAPSAQVRTSVGTGDPRDAFESASAHADLLVVGSNHDSSWRGLFGNSFSVKMAEGARCPVVVVPKDWRPHRGPVVVGVLGDDTDEVPLTFALREAREGSRGLRLVHARVAPRIIGARHDEAGNGGRDESALAGATMRLRDENPGMTIDYRLAQGDPAESLLLQSADAGLLVVGSHTRSTFDRFFLGSVSRDVLLQPPCAVAVVRSQATAVHRR